ncbi:MAG: shikimate dehydrogenase [Bacteroidetes bacterium]|nr:MAG: shikimate dehydrogenase [Bacteroidota bacterium]
MRQFGLIAYPVAHSFSKQYFEKKFAQEGISDAVYELYPLPQIEDLPALIQAKPELCGLNVSIPHKQAVIPYLDELSDEAKAIGAVNTIRIERQGGKIRLLGFNTDYSGFRNSLEPRLSSEMKSALVLGNGGSSKTVQKALSDLAIDFRVVSRGGELNYHTLQASDVESVQLIVNTTPLGMWPNTDQAPEIPYEAINANHLLFDLVYNPEPSKFLTLGAKKGARIKGGLEMLSLQAEAAWTIWNA